MTERRICSHYRCGWRGHADQIIIAPHPFIPDATVTGCPNCKDIDCTRVACDEPDCWEAATIGMPTSDGYRYTCFAHMPKEKS